jgi:UDP-glucuronate decarboxylase
MLNANRPRKETILGNGGGRRIGAHRRVLVTGGAGFIGSHLCDRLVQKGHRVICIDNLYSGDISNIRPLMNHPNFQFMQHDVRDPLVIAGPVDRIYNLACAASPPHYQSDPIGTMKTCVLGAFNMLELARQKGATILQSSTSEVYGDPLEHPQAEGYFGNVNPTGPRACYDEGKRAAETLFFDYRRMYGLPIKVARIFNTYGPRMLENDGRVISNFVIQALCNEPITIYGDGSQTRSFCYIDDLLNGLELLMESPDHVTGPCNLGNPHETTIGDIARMIVAQTASRSKLNFKPLPQDDPKRRRPVIDKAKSLLGWNPRIPLEQGLNETIAYFTLKVFTPKDVTKVVAPMRPSRVSGTTQRLMPSASASPGMAT